MKSVEQVTAAFKEKFRATPTAFIAPGRINLIGEHTDYNEGFVMPAAVDKHLVFAIAPSRTDKCNIYASDLGEGVSFSIHDLNPGQTWVNYLMGVLDAFQRKGLPVKGVDVVLGGDIPVGAGLSSSAALCCGFGFALNDMLGWNLGKLEIAKVAQSSEHHFVGAKVGIMDQYASLFGKKDSVLLLDCRALTHEYLPFDFPETVILLVDSKVKHSLASSAYNDRRASCEEGLSMIRKKNPSAHSLRDVSRTLLYEFQDAMGEDVFSKCRYVVEEMARTRQAAEWLKSGKIAEFGRLMNETHWGLSKLYDVSCPELDLLVTLAEDHRDAVLGSRMMGGGFGGCTINLVRKGQEENFRASLRQKYFATFKKEPGFYSVRPSDGVHRVPLPN